MFLENHAVYEVIWKNLIQPDRQQMTIRSMRIAPWISKSTTNTHSDYVILIAFPLQQLLQALASVLCYTYISCLVLLVFVKCNSSMV